MPTKVWDAGDRRFRYRLPIHLYANGKSAVRVNAPGVQEHGPHYFKTAASPRWISEDNTQGGWRNSVSRSTVVLHYTYTSMRDIARKGSRKCPNLFEANGTKINETALSECVIMAFDRRAYVAALGGNQTEIERFFSIEVSQLVAAVDLMRSHN